MYVDVQLNQWISTLTNKYEISRIRWAPRQCDVRRGILLHVMYNAINPPCADSYFIILARAERFVMRSRNSLPWLWLKQLHNEVVALSLNSIYFQINIYTWQHTSIQIHGKWIRKQVT